MSEAILEKFSCDACSRSYSWKAQLAGKRVKCKCGSVMTVPAALKPENSDFGPDDEGGFDLEALARADERAVKSTANHTAELRVMPMAAAVVRTPRLSAAPPMSPPLGYRTGQPSAREAQLKSHLIDMTRDVWAPLTLLVLGFGLYVGDVAFSYHLNARALGFVCFGISVLTIIKAAMLIVFAMIVAGPLEVSFGGVWTAALKLAAIAVVCDGATAWLGTIAARGVGGLGIYAITWPASLFIYWGLLVYLFSMDFGDARLTVAVLTIFDRLVKTALIVLLANALGIGGFGNSAVGSAASSAVAGFGAATARPRHSIYTEELAEYKEFKQWREAKKYIADGHREFLKSTVDAMYAAGAPEIGFEVTKDINGRGESFIMLVEMPADPVARKKILQLRHDVMAANQMGADPSDLIDHPDDDYIPVRVR